jgi:hypothetical protein
MVLVYLPDILLTLNLPRRICSGRQRTEGQTTVFCMKFGFAQFRCTIRVRAREQMFDIHVHAYI